MPHLSSPATLLLCGCLSALGCAAEPAPDSEPAPDEERTAPAPLPMTAAPTWTTATPMTVARASAAAALLLDGRVLVAGGNTVAEPQGMQKGAQSGELFDPAAGETGQWAPVQGMMANPHAHHVAVLLDGGDVIVAGGQYVTGTDRFDHKHGVFISAGPMDYGRVQVAAVPLPGRGALVVGGYGWDPVSGYATLASGLVFSPDTGTWAVLPNDMHAPRHDFTATLVDGGPRVLVVGGADDASAEAYDPESGQWTLAAPMGTPRFDHTATRIELDQHEMVLVAGGTAADGAALDRVDLYDTATNAWSAGPPMHARRSGHTATLLTNGAVLVVGGVDELGSALRTAELFDPVEKRWVSLAPLVRTRVNHTATRLADGRVLVAGGDHEAGAEIYRLGESGASCEVGRECASGHCIDAVCCGTECPDKCHSCALPGSEGTCSAAPAGTDPRLECGNGDPCADACGPDGECTDKAGAVCSPSACTAGGDHAMPSVCQSGQTACPAPGTEDCGGFRCDPGEGECAKTCVSVGDCAPGFACDLAHRCVRPPDKAGGDTSACSAAPSPDHRNPLGAAIALFACAAVIARRRAPSRNRPRAQPKRSRIADSALASAAIALIAAALGAGCGAGTDSSGDSGEALFGTAHQPQGASPPAWTERAPMTQAHTGDAVKLLDGRVLVAGGGGITAEVYDPKKDTWTRTGNDLAFSADDGWAELLLDGRVLVGGKGGPPWQAAVYDPGLDTWTVTFKMPFGDVFGRAARLADGRVLSAGGYSANTRAQVFDPATEHWHSTKNTMVAVRWDHTITLLPDGRAIVVGGADGNGFIYRPIEVYDPAANTWQLGAKTLHTHVFHTATLLGDGTVMIVGGEHDYHVGSEGVPQDNTEIYLPATNQWVEGPPLHTARSRHTATLLGNGALLVAGGFDASGSSLSSAEVYDGAAWTTIDSMHDERTSHTATLLDDGGVLVAGGTYQATAEVFHLGPNGAPCSTWGTCESGFCVEGVCCESACDDGCRSCAAPGFEGLCVIPCTDDTHVKSCGDSAGTCAPYRCEQDLGACGVTCQSVEDCAAGFACNTEHRCVAPPDVAGGDPGMCAVRTAPLRDERAPWEAPALVLATLLWRRRRAARLVP